MASLITCRRCSEMKVKALRKFTDLKEDKLREKGAVFEVTEKRFREINSTIHGALVETIEEPKPEVEEEAWSNEQDD